MVKKNWQHQTHKRAALVFDQLAGVRRIAENAVMEGWPEAPYDVDAFVGESPYIGMLDKLYGEDFQLARLLDSSDLIFHAEGPAASDAMPQLRAVNWLCAGVDKNLRRLAEVALQMSGEQAARIVRGIDFRLTGMAPGSLYIGFAIAPSVESMPGIPYGEDEPSYIAVRDAFYKLPLVSQFIRDEYIDGEIADAMPDPALRDASLTASYHLAPTGKIGIHTLDIGRPDERPGSLSQRERVVLREVAIKRTMLMNRQQGSFVGELREIDLDANRFQLRNVPGIGSIRCAMPIAIDKIRPLIGLGVRVEGSYETDRSGRPRLMQVEIVTPYQLQTEIA